MRLHIIFLEYVYGRLRTGSNRVHAHHTIMHDASRMMQSKQCPATLRPARNEMDNSQASPSTAPEAPDAGSHEFAAQLSLQEDGARSFIWSVPGLVLANDVPAILEGLLQYASLLGEILDLRREDRNRGSGTCLGMCSSKGASL